MEQISLDWGPQRRVLTVAELTLELRGLLSAEYSDIWVAGEISGCRRAASGHYYFTLKDADAQLKCACFRNAARLLRFQPEDGVEVLARGRIDVYPPRGEYQLLVETIEPQGHGALQLAFEQLKRRLEAEGLFAAERKRPLPRIPRRIGIVTSPSGAAIRDLVHVLSRRFAGVHIRLYPALVQGEGSAASVIEGIEHFSRSEWAEVVIVGRGGGSIEDLWTFNEESVARAIAASEVPVVSAVGHETDFTVADFVADLRAPTPSAAAELVAPERRELEDRVEAERRKLTRAVEFRIARSWSLLHEQGIDRAATLVHRNIGRLIQHTDDLDYRMRNAVHERLAARRRRLEELETRLKRKDLRLELANARRRLDTAAQAIGERFRLRLAALKGLYQPLDAQLHQLGPLRVLERGYAIVQNPAGAVIRDAAQSSAGDELLVRLSKGRLRVEVKG